MTIVEQIKDLAKQLDEKEKSEMAAWFLENMQEYEDDPAEVEAAWNKEIKQRIDDLDSGKAKTIPVEQVMTELREKFNL